MAWTALQRIYHGAALVAMKKDGGLFVICREDQGLLLRVDRPTTEAVTEGGQSQERSLLKSRSRQAAPASD